VRFGGKNSVFVLWRKNFGAVDLPGEVELLHDPNPVPIEVDLVPLQAVPG
jgi:hypothetical protein